MLELHNISKSYGNIKALGPLDLRMAPRQTTVLIGPSGCGKSTLLRIIIGLIRSDTGTVQIENTEITPAGIDSIRRKIGYVIQDGGLFPHLTAQQNVDLMGRYLGWSASKSRYVYQSLLS